MAAARTASRVMPLRDDRMGAEPDVLGQEAQHEVHGPDEAVAGGAGLVPGRHHDVAGLRGEAPEPLLGIDPVGPGRTRAPGPVDEVADEVVGDRTEVVGGEYRVGEPVEWLGVDPVLTA